MAYSICIPSVMMSVESIIESFGSVHANRNKRKRPTTEEGAPHEMLVAMNGPELAHRDSLPKVCMSNNYKSF